MRPASLIQFFATRSDLDPGLRAIDANHDLRFAEDRYYESREISLLKSILSLPSLGTVSSRRSPRFVVLPAGKKVRVTRVVQIGKPSIVPKRLAVALALAGIRPPGGRVVYEIRPSNQPTSIEFAPGGFARARVLVAGEIATVHNDSQSSDLFRLFESEVLRGYTRIKSFVVGP